MLRKQLIPGVQKFKVILLLLQVSKIQHNEFNSEFITFNFSASGNMLACPIKGNFFILDSPLHCQSIAPHRSKPGDDFGVSVGVTPDGRLSVSVADTKIRKKGRKGHVVQLKKS